MWIWYMMYIWSNTYIATENTSRTESQKANLELEENSTITTGRILSCKRMFQKCYIEVVPTKYFHYILYNHSNDYLSFDLGIANETLFFFFNGVKTTNAYYFD